jgi:hypothetical protein
MRYQSRRVSPNREPAANVVLFTCAASAGIHAGIVPEHLREEPRIGVAFLITVAVLLGLGTAIALRPLSHRLAWLASLVLGGLIAAYVVSRTTGIPFLSPDPETVDPVGIAALATELLGLGCALWLIQPIRRRRRRPVLQEVSR